MDTNPTTTVKDDYFPPPVSSSWLFSGANFYVWFFIFLFVVLFGSAIFLYLARGTEMVKNMLQRVSTMFLPKNIKGSESGTKDSVDAAEEDALSNQLTDNNEHQEVNENVLDKAQVTAQGNVKGAPVYMDKQSQSVYPVNVAHDNGQNELSMTLNKATNNYNQYGGAVPPQTASFEADDSYSAIQASKATSKAGWCFIGEDRGFRSCIEVGDNDKCMSGDIFPTMDICVNPSLRQ
jgi:hypothetical protein